MKYYRLNPDPDDGIVFLKPGEYFLDTTNEALENAIRNGLLNYIGKDSIFEVIESSRTFNNKTTLIVGINLKEYSEVPKEAQAGFFWIKPTNLSLVTIHDSLYSAEQRKQLKLFDWVYKISPDLLNTIKETAETIEETAKEIESKAFNLTKVIVFSAIGISLAIIAVKFRK